MTDTGDLTREAIARHEAGHAVLFWNLEIDLEFVSLFPMEGYLGYCRRESRPLTDRRSLIKNIMGSLAGVITMDRSGKSEIPKTFPRGATNDIEQANRCLSLLEPDLPSHRRMALLFLLYAEVRTLMRTSEVSRQIEMLAADLQSHSMLMGIEVETCLCSLPESIEATVMSQKAVDEILAQWPSWLARVEVSGMEPEDSV